MEKCTAKYPHFMYKASQCGYASVIVDLIQLLYDIKACGFEQLHQFAYATDII